MKIEFKHVNGVPTLKFTNNEKLRKYSLHIWRISTNYKNDRVREHISGWQNSDIYTLKVLTPGKYFAKVFQPDNSRFETDMIEITRENLLLYSNEESLIEISREWNKSSKDQYLVNKLIEQMYLIGKENIYNQIAPYLKKNTTISIFSSYKTSQLSNCIFSLSFFDGKFKTPKFFGEKAANNGYLFSMSFRNYFDPVSSAEFRKDDLLIVCEENKTNENSKIIKNAIANKANVLYLSKIIRRAYRKKYLIDPLLNSPAKTIYIELPTSKRIKLPTESENIASHTSIGMIRRAAKKGIYPKSLNGMSDEYIQDVLYGWDLEKKLGYDILKDHKSEFANVKNGHRIIPENGVNKINNNGKVYFFGNSVIYGIGSDDGNTLPSLFAKKMNLVTENKANFSMNDFVRGTNLVKNTYFSPDDVIIFGSHEILEKDEQSAFDKYINMQKYFDHPRKYEEEVFLDMTHLNKYGYEIMTDALMREVNF
ncbi:hypothetical protein [Weissella paramesenteroides]|uniref:hypothetical protein n=1 Tax=Weissella paramesenteroides TaxID=1249 RepID=UPI003857901E